MTCCCCSRWRSVVVVSVRTPNGIRIRLDSSDDVTLTIIDSTPIAPRLCVWAFGTYTCLHTCFQSLKQPIEAGLPDVHAQRGVGSNQKSSGLVCSIDRSIPRHVRRRPSRFRGDPDRGHRPGHAEFPVHRVQPQGSLGASRVRRSVDLSRSRPRSVPTRRSLPFLGTTLRRCASRTRARDGSSRTRKRSGRASCPASRGACGNPPSVGTKRCMVAAD